MNSQSVAAAASRKAGAPRGKVVSGVVLTFALLTVLLTSSGVVAQPVQEVWDSKTVSVTFASGLYYSPSDGTWVKTTLHIQAEMGDRLEPGVMVTRTDVYYVTTDRWDNLIRYASNWSDEFEMTVDPNLGEGSLVGSLLMNGRSMDIDLTLNAENGPGTSSGETYAGQGYVDHFNRRGRSCAVAGTVMYDGKILVDEPSGGLNGMLMSEPADQGPLGPIEPEPGLSGMLMSEHGVRVYSVAE